MSHTTTIETKLTDADAIKEACIKCNAELTEGKTKLFDGAEAEGYIVKLPGWLYPVVIDKTTGEAKFDNFNNKWGKIEVFNQLKQEYAVAAARKNLLRKGFRVVEQRANGKVTLQAVR